MEKIRTLIVDGEPLAREGVRVLLRDDPKMEMVGECGTGQEAEAMIKAERPDLLSRIRANVSSRTTACLTDARSSIRKAGADGESARVF
jgi:hypothetical protein